MNWELLAKLCHELLHDGKIDTDTGICTNIEYLALRDDQSISYLESLLWEAFRAWPEFSGNVNYPVPCGDDSQAGYWRTALWEGEYGAARMRLLNFVHSYACAKASNFPMRDVGPFKALLTEV
jgi:hypothetical protein